MKMVLRMFFLTFSNTEIPFINKELVWSGYIIVEALPIIKEVELIGNREFAVVAL